MRDKRQESTVCGNRVWRAGEVAELWRLRIGDGVEVEVEAGQGGKTPAPPAGQVDRREPAKAQQLDGSWLRLPNGRGVPAPAHASTRLANQTRRQHTTSPRLVLTPGPKSCLLR
ncbi:predicted protein [Histoplasma capsulatum var. duboisii H88]|uniref:Predicted protein n=1 Tax=Ajellomyces capsulatus (strain H88) TaxID=544711 RepID=F0ULT3_AJEC8|nr:predicted protein [Histoplasma capsulatum var. duboisii H88]